MPKLRELRKQLRQAGFYVKRVRGSHETWQHMTVSGAIVILAGKDSADADPYQLRDVERALEKVRRSG